MIYGAKILGESSSLCYSLGKGGFAVNRRNLRYFSLPLAITVLLFALDVLCLSHSGQTPAGRFPCFRARSLQGQTYDEGFFSGHLTLVCLWVTGDSASAKFLADLSAWQQAEDIPLQMVGLVGDIRDDAPADRISRARELAQGLPKTFPQLTANDSLAPFLTAVKAAPTCVFVDREGKIAGQPIAGFEVELIKKEARRLSSTDSLENKMKNRLQARLLR